jgi:glutamine amidotransferase
MIGILRYGAGNVASIQTAMARLGVPSRPIESRDEVAAVKGIILPGTGAAPAAMAALRDRGLIELIRGCAKPCLGICLGMQLLFNGSEEGDVSCLGIIDGCVRKIPSGVVQPHMGWNQLNNGEYVYFAHSYVCEPADQGVVTMTVGYGAFELCAGVRFKNFFGVQWHPEKSGPVGQHLLGGFAKLCN